jgi:hypothetical protein
MTFSDIKNIRAKKSLRIRKMRKDIIHELKVGLSTGQRICDDLDPKFAGHLYLLRYSGMIQCQIYSSIKVIGLKRRHEARPVW